MAFRKGVGTQPSNERKHIKQRRSRSSSPKCSKSYKTARYSSAPDSASRYALEKKIKRSSRHASPKLSNRKHRKASPKRRKVCNSFI